jgi:hypothetical protein
MAGVLVCDGTLAEAWFSHDDTGVHKSSGDGFSLFRRYIDMRMSLVFWTRGIDLETNVTPELLGREARQRDQPGSRPETRKGRVGRTGQRSDINRETRELESGRGDSLFLVVPPVRVCDAAIKFLFAKILACGDNFQCFFVDYPLWTW